MSSQSSSGREGSERVVRAPDGDPFDLAWIGRSTGRAERRQVVVLAVGFDPVKVTDPEELVDALSRRRHFVLDIVARSGGSVGRIDPNLQIVAWGWPVAGEADTRFAVSAALEIAADTSQMARCGVDAGIAITSDAENGLFDLGFVGEMVGAAVSFQATASAGEVVVSDAVARLVADAFILIECRERQADVPLWLVERRGVRPRERIGRCVGQSPRIGRNAERAEIGKLLNAAMSGQAQLLRIEGVAGVGKTALVEWIEQEAARLVTEVVLVPCLPEQQHKPLEPVRRLIGKLARIPSPARSATAAGALVIDAFPCDGDVEGAALFAACGEALRSKKFVVETMARLLAELIAYKSRSRSLVVVIEDMHWADETSARVVDDLGRPGCLEFGALLVVTSRPVRGSGASKEGCCRWRQLHLARHSLSEMQQLVDTCEFAAALDAETRERIAERSDGIPFIAFELAQLCAKHADKDGDHRLLARPNRLNSALTNRLDALATLKPLAQAAAVLGRLFDSRVLASVLGMEDRVIDERLAMLVDMGLLMPRRGRGGLYRFQDALLWSQAYGSVLKARRRDLHRRIAGVMEGDAGEKFETRPEIVAHHWKKSGDQAKAFEWWFRASLEAAERGAAARAVAFINHALTAKELAPHACSAHDEATLMSVLGGQLRVLRGSASREVVAAFERAMEVVSNMPARPDDIDLEIAWGISTIHLVRGDIQAAAESSSRLLSEATERNRHDISLLALRGHGTARLLAGAVCEAIRLLEDATSRYDRNILGEFQRGFVSDPGAVTFAHLANAYAIAGNKEAARGCRHKALQLAAEMKHPHTSANVLGVLTISAVHMGETGVATALARGCKEISTQHGFQYWCARSDIIFAWQASVQNPVGGLDAMRVARDAYAATGSSRAAVFSACLTADVAIRAGRAKDAIALLASVRDAGERRGEWLYMPDVQRLEAWAMVEDDAGQLLDARRKLDAADAMSRKHGSVSLQVRIDATRALIERIAKRRPAVARSEAAATLQ